jgi:hypothetical protein
MLDLVTARPTSTTLVGRDAEFAALCDVFKRRAQDRYARGFRHHTCLWRGSHEKGESDTKLSPSQDAIVGDVRRVWQQINESAFPSLPLHFTEWSTSYTPRKVTVGSSGEYTLSIPMRTNDVVLALLTAGRGSSTIP